MQMLVQYDYISMHKNISHKGANNQPIVGIFKRMKTAYLTIYVVSLGLGKLSTSVRVSTRINKDMMEEITWNDFGIDLCE